MLLQPGQVFWMLYPKDPGCVSMVPRHMPRHAPIRDQTSLLFSNRFTTAGNADKGSFASATTTSFELKKRLASPAIVSGSPASAGAVITEIMGGDSTNTLAGN
eukprot:168260-Rhodomonas_salina.2